MGFATTRQRRLSATTTCAGGNVRSTRIMPKEIATDRYRTYSLGLIVASRSDRMWLFVWFRYRRASRWISQAHPISQRRRLVDPTNMSWWRFEIRCDVRREIEKIQFRSGVRRNGGNGMMTCRSLFFLLHNTFLSCLTLYGKRRG